MSNKNNMPEGVFTLSPCPRCNYKYAKKNNAKDGSSEYLLCLRCGYVKQTFDGEIKEYLCAGAYVIVANQGVVAGAGFEEKSFIKDRIPEIKKMVGGGKVFYTVNEESKYYLVDSDNGKKFEFGESDEIYIGGTRRSN